MRNHVFRGEFIRTGERSWWCGEQFIFCELQVGLFQTLKETIGINYALNENLNYKLDAPRNFPISLFIQRNVLQVSGGGDEEALSDGLASGTRAATKEKQRQNPS